jgi:integrase/recombinase XerD
MESLTDNSTSLVTLSSRNLIEQAISGFLADQDIKENSRSTYRRALKQFFDRIEKKGIAVNSLTRVDILAYKDHLIKEGMSSLTAASYLTSVRRFYEWIEANKIGSNIAKGIKTPRRKQQFRKQPLTIDQSKFLLYHFKDSPRDFAIVSLALRTGLRTVEIIRANIGDIKIKGDQRVLMVHGKGRDEKDAFVILSDKAISSLQGYISTRVKPRLEEPLFISNSNQNKDCRLTTRSISRIIKEGLRAIGLDSHDLTAHSLRHTTAITLLKTKGTRLEDVQGVLRHANPATTQIYTATIKDELRLKNKAENRLDKMF